jgi:hypothetical protein
MVATGSSSDGMGPWSIQRHETTRHDTTRHGATGQDVASLCMASGVDRARDACAVAFQDRDVLVDHRVRCDHQGGFCNGR